MNNILFVFEGEVSESRAWNSLKANFANDFNDSLIISFNCGEIYSLYHRLENDKDEDLIGILKTKKINEPALAGISRSSISEIYLFFDYDAHATAADDEKLAKMLELFDNETDNGLLYVSYPMIESIRHLNDEVDFSGVTCERGSFSNYKNIVSKTSGNNFKDYNSYDEKRWAHVISCHCKKANALISGDYTWPSNQIPQSSIFKVQKSTPISSMYSDPFRYS